MKLCFASAGIFIAVVFGFCQPSEAALTGHYLFEEGSGTTALDSSAFGRDGTLTSAVGGETPSYTAGLYQGSSFALLFDRSNKERVDLPQSTDFIRNAPGATILAWVRVDEETTFGTGLFPTIAQVNSANTADFNGFGGARAAITNSHNFGFRSVGSRISEPRNGANSGFCSTGFNCPIEGESYFVAGVFDYVNGTNAVFINGVEAVKNTNVPTWNGNSHDAANLFASIGASPDPAASASLAWQGAIDGVRIYDEALSAQVILDTYNAEVIVSIPGDYNGDGKVDAADYIVWRKDPASNGGDPAGYDIWRANFGAMAGSGSAALSGGRAVPEPASWAVILLLITAYHVGVRTRIHFALEQ